VHVFVCACTRVFMRVYVCARAYVRACVLSCCREDGSFILDIISCAQPLSAL